MEEYIMSGANAKRTRILIVDENAIFRDGLAARLNKKKDFFAIAETMDYEKMADAVIQRDPRVLCYDIGEDARRGFENLAKIKEACNGGMMAIAMSDNRSKSVVRDFLNAGGMGYLLKTSPFGEYVEAIRKSLGGEKHICNELVAGLFQERLSREQALYNGFTGKRKIVLRLFARGMTRKEIAAELGMKLGAAEYHVRETMNAFNVNGPIELYTKLQALELD